MKYKLGDIVYVNYQYDKDEIIEITDTHYIVKDLSHNNENYIHSIIDYDRDTELNEHYMRRIQFNKEIEEIINETN